MKFSIYLNRRVFVMNCRDYFSIELRPIKKECNSISVFIRFSVSRKKISFKPSVYLPTYHKNNFPKILKYSLATFLNGIKPAQ